jgi:hypothetical protein
METMDEMNGSRCLDAMLYTIIKSFSATNDSWDSYCHWRGLNFAKFDSIDGLLRPSLFVPKTTEEGLRTCPDVGNFNYLTDREYAEKKWHEIGSGDLVALRFSDHDEKQKGFLGFDLVDGYYDVSLLTNWGNDNELINQVISSNALVSRLEKIVAVQNHVFESYSDDAHAADCHIVSIYDPFRI